MYDRILIAVDGSDEAEHAARWGLELATRLEATVDVLHVVPRKSLRLTKTADEKARLREHGETALSTVEALAAELDCPVSSRLLEGKPAAQISDYAASQNADFVVVGRQGKTGLGKRLLGGVTEQVLHRCDVPVFVVPDASRVSGQATDDTRVLVPTDGSENAAAATQYGATIARAYDADVHVLNVVDMQAAGGMFDAGGLEAEFVERLAAKGQEAVERVADAIRETAPGLNVSTAVEQTASFEGSAAGIREYVEDNGIDLVVMGSHGRSNLRRQLLGSVASTVLRTVDVPVLVVTRRS